MVVPIEHALLAESRRISVRLALRGPLDDVVMLWSVDEVRLPSKPPRRHTALVLNTG